MRSFITSIGVAGLLFAGIGQAAAVPLSPAESAAVPVTVQAGNGSVQNLIESGSVQIPVAVFWKLVCTLSSCDFPGTPA
ncbi:hypothetical protein [Nocardia inohanensis]|uniref:hypothetical protein n=1 Tax=Nocardia inohanensis TaxID=209246 RepID=UPI00082A4458|nr:hypothetical protein [Nocardia inohanensis]